MPRPRRSERAATRTIFDVKQTKNVYVLKKIQTGYITALFTSGNGKPIDCPGEENRQGKVTKIERSTRNALFVGGNATVEL